MVVDYPNVIELVNTSAFMCCIRWPAWFSNSIILGMVSRCVIIWNHVVTVLLSMTKLIVYVQIVTQ